MKNEPEIKNAIEKYADMVWRICYLYMQQPADAEDIFQNVFLKYTLYSGTFENQEHEKAWLIRVATNCCKDHLKSAYHRQNVPLSDVYQYPCEETFLSNGVTEALKTLPEKYKTVLYLNYYEGYTAAEIGGILHKRENTIYTWISRGKKLLKEVLLKSGYQ